MGGHRTAQHDDNKVLVIRTFEDGIVLAVKAVGRILTSVERGASIGIVDEAQVGVQSNDFFVFGLGLTVFFLNEGSPKVLGVFYLGD